MNPFDVSPWFWTIVMVASGALALSYRDCRREERLLEESRAAGVAAWVEAVGR